MRLRLTLGSTANVHRQSTIGALQSKEIAMRKAILALASTLIAAPLLASPVLIHLPGVSDSETTIPYGDVRQSVRGHRDVLFVKDRNSQWYRLQLNAGCMGTTTDTNRLVFNHHGSGQAIDRFTTVLIPEEKRSCAIQSIRRSLPPPQVDTRSPVTLD
jgi:hypothetical protein